MASIRKAKLSPVAVNSVAASTGEVPASHATRSRRTNIHCAGVVIFAGWGPAAAEANNIRRRARLLSVARVPVVTPTATVAKLPGRPTGLTKCRRSSSRKNCHHQNKWKAAGSCSEPGFACLRSPLANDSFALHGIHYRILACPLDILKRIWLAQKNS